jgi:hypothetical protein
MTTAYAIHSIFRKGGEVPAGTIAEFTDEEFAELRRLGSIRLLTKDEAAIHGALQQVAVEPEPDLERMALEAHAEELGIKFNKNISNVKLSERIAEAEEKAAAAEADADLAI